MTLLRQAAVLGVLLSVGCVNSTAPSSPVNGTWTRDFPVPGMGFQMTLDTHGNVVSGSGTWAGEACCTGVVSVTGSVIDGVVTLDMSQTRTQGAMVPPFTSHLEGRADLNTLNGVLTAFRNQRPYDPTEWPGHAILL